MKTLLKKIWKHRWLLRACVDGRLPPPTWVLIDPASGFCNLHCPLCALGDGSLEIKRQMMSLDDFKTIVDKLPASVKELYLYNWGEPLLNPAFEDMVAYAKSKRPVLTFIDTNLSVPLSDERIEKIIRAGLDSMTVSLDGATEEAYLKYRRGGQHARVLQNLKTFVRLKKELGSSTPAIDWKMIVHRQNEHELETARKMAAEIGVKFSVTTIQVPRAYYDEWAPSPAYPITAKDSDRGSQSICTYLFQSMVINSDGTVSTCCHAYKQCDLFGNLLEQDFDEIWNNNKFKLARNLFVPMLIKPKGDINNTSCIGCTMYVPAGRAIKTRFRKWLKK